MMMTLYRRNVKGTVAVWTIQHFGCEVVREWGIDGGKMQRTSQLFKARQNKSGIDLAGAFAERLVKAKHEEGFSVRKDGVRVSHTLQKSDLTFLTLPKSFAPQKPIQEPPHAGADPSRFIIQRKRDGQRHFALVTPRGRVKLYSRKLNDMTAHMPLLVRELEDLELPPCSILDGEIICDRRGVDDFRATNEVCRAKAERAMFAERRLPIKFVVFDYLYRNKEPLWQQPYEQRYEHIYDEVVDGVRITLPETFEDFAKAQRWVTKHGWEGLVLWDKQARCVLRMDGKPQRSGCYKWKPVCTGDFVAIGWLPGKGRLANTVGKLRIAEWQNKKLIEICNVGTGFDNKTRDAAMRWTYPLVVELKYAFQQSDTRALREPVFLRRHPDKSVKELR